MWVYQYSVKCKNNSNFISNSPNNKNHYNLLSTYYISDALFTYYHDEQQSYWIHITFIL